MKRTYNVFKYYHWLNVKDKLLAKYVSKEEAKKFVEELRATKLSKGIGYYAKLNKYWEGD